MFSFEIAPDDLTDGQVEQLLIQHRQEMFLYAPPESIHALESSALRNPDLQFWSARTNKVLLGCGALKILGNSEGEVKSMRTKAEYLRLGVAQQILTRVIAEAKQRQYRSLFLETGRHRFFSASIQLYQKLGFVECGPFADYQEDPSSIFMTLNLDNASTTSS